MIRTPVCLTKLIVDPTTHEDEVRPMKGIFSEQSPGMFHETCRSHFICVKIVNEKNEIRFNAGCQKP